MNSLLDEFKTLVEASGWSMQECADRIHVHRGHLSALLSGKKNLQEDRLKLLRYAIQTEKPEVLASVAAIRAYALHEGQRTLEDWESTLLTELHALNDDQRRRAVEHIRGLIGLIPTRPSKYRISSKPNAAEQAALDLAAREAEHLPAEPSRKAGAAGPNSRASAPKPASDKG